MLSKISLYSFLSSLQEMNTKLLCCEDLADQQYEEMYYVDDTYSKIWDYQKHEAIPEGIRKFSFIEMKKFEVFIGSGKAVIKEAIDVVTQTKKSCARIWDSSEVMMEIFELPRLENRVDSIPCKLFIEPVEVEQETIDDEVLRI